MDELLICNHAGECCEQRCHLLDGQMWDEFPNPNIRFKDWEAEQMQDPEFRAAVEELEPAYQVARLRIKRRSRG